MRFFEGPDGNRAPRAHPSFRRANSQNRIGRTHLQTKDAFVRIGAHTMIAGNPKTGRKLATMAVALFIAMLLVSIFLAMRKRTAPLEEPPLLPSVVLVVIGPSC